MKTVSFYGEIKADFSDKVTFGVNGTYSDYNTTYQSEAWNVPTIKLNATLDVAITEKWYAGVKVFYVGERKDMQLNKDIVYIVAPGPITLASYFDANAHVGYKYSERLTGFLKLNNIGNQTYQKWLNYPVQGFQVLIGGNYKFDF